jgi:hypothetical protein
MYRIFSPFSYGEDGQLIGLYVEELQTGYRITDACESFMHASAMGLSITDARMSAVRKSIGRGAELSGDGEISALVSKEDLSAGLIAVLNGSLAVSQSEAHWKPRRRNETFLESVTLALESRLGSRVMRGVSVKGASGHQLEIPLAIQLPSETIYVEPVAAAEDDEINWKNVYSSFGRMMDLKKANIEGTSRLIVLEDASNEQQFQFALNVLTETSKVIQYSKLPEWTRKIAA